jgi:hypothetical protein
MCPNADLLVQVWLYMKYIINLIFFLNSVSADNPSSTFHPAVKCLSCDIGANCQYVQASFSSSGKYYILGCLGPDIPHYTLKSTVNPNVCKYMYRYNLSRLINAKFEKMGGWGATTISAVPKFQSEHHRIRDKIYTPNTNIHDSSLS